MLPECPSDNSNLQHVESVAEVFSIDNRNLLELAEREGVQIREGLDSNHFVFEATGVPEIDIILGAVCRAGKNYHSTSGWAEEGWNGGPSEIANIQKAANLAAAALRARAA